MVYHRTSHVKIRMAARISRRESVGAYFGRLCGRRFDGCLALVHLFISSQMDSNRAGWILCVYFNPLYGKWNVEIVILIILLLLII